MALKYSIEAAKWNTTPVPGRADGKVTSGTIHRWRATIVLAAAGQGAVTGDDHVLLAEISEGFAFAFGAVTSSVSLAAAQVAIGTGVSHATNGQWRAAATMTATDAPQVFGRAAAVAAPATDRPTRIYLTSSAALPTAGTLVIDLYLSGAS